MPSRGRYVTSTEPVIVEVTPQGLSSRSTNTPPLSPGSPKAVRFAPDTKGESRDLTQVETWSLYHFECHARECYQCYNPLDVQRDERQLCATGDALAQDVALHVFRKNSEVYSTKKVDSELVRVKMPKDYSQVAQLLRSRERATRSTSRTVPIISYAPTTAPREVPELVADAEPRRKRQTVIIEPATTTSEHVSRRKSKHRSDKYKTVVVEDNTETASSSSTTTKRERRGSLYYDDVARQRKDAYKVEIREPQRRESRRDKDQDRDRERPRSLYYS